MEIGFVGLGKMGLNMVTRIQRGGHQAVAYDVNPDAVEAAGEIGAIMTGSLEEMVSDLKPPRVIWVMVPAGDITESVINDLSKYIKTGDIVIDGGNSNFHDSKRRATELSEKGIHFLDVGTSGGIWGLKNGYSLMAGGNLKAYEHVEPIFKSLAPAEGYLHVGSSGAGHYVKMIHNGIEYGMMQVYAEGFEILEKSEYNFDLTALCHLWNHGAVIRSWLLELAELALSEDPHLNGIKDFVADSGEGRWTMIEAIDHGIPAMAIAQALMTRFSSQQEESFAGKVLAALRQQFGGHPVKEK
jgi:6-phosphogluconate dehydrogenase